MYIYVLAYDVFIVHNIHVYVYLIYTYMYICVMAAYDLF